MSDEVDRASQEVERAHAEAQRHRKPQGPMYTGCCSNCGENTPAERRWCDAACRDQWERETARRTRLHLS